MNQMHKVSFFIFTVVLMSICSCAFAAVENVRCIDVTTTASNGDVTLDGLKTTVTKLTKDFRDVTMTAVVTYRNKRALAKVEESFTRLYEFKTAKISAKSPDKMKTEGRLGMLSFTYIVNDTTRIVRIPSIRMNKKDENKDQPSKVQDLSDMGILTPSAWRIRELCLCPDPEAASKDQVLINAAYPKNTMQNMFWIDTKNYCLTRFEKRDASGKVTIRLEYSKPQYFGNAIWLPTVVEIFAPDGERAGAMELRDIKVNTGLTDSMFE